MARSEYIPTTASVTAAAPPHKDNKQTPQTQNIHTQDDVRKQGQENVAESPRWAGIDQVDPGWSDIILSVVALL